MAQLDGPGPVADQRDRIASEAAPPGDGTQITEEAEPDEAVVNAALESVRWRMKSSYDIYQKKLGVNDYESELIGTKSLARASIGILLDVQGRGGPGDGVMSPPKGGYHFMVNDTHYRFMRGEFPLYDQLSDMMRETMDASSAELRGRRVPDDVHKGVLELYQEALAWIEAEPHLFIK